MSDPLTPEQVARAREDFAEATCIMSGCHDRLAVWASYHAVPLLSSLEATQSENVELRKDYDLVCATLAKKILETETLRAELAKQAKALQDILCEIPHGIDAHKPGDYPTHCQVCNERLPCDWLVVVTIARGAIPSHESKAWLERRHESRQASRKRHDR